MMDVAAAPRDRRMPIAEVIPAVRFESVTKSFGARKVLDGISFDVPPGCGYAIIGRSGTGKSVALRHVIGLVVPDAGRVFVHGDEVSALRGPELSRVRRGVGFLFQNAALFDSISVGENVAFPLRRHTTLREHEIRQRALEKLAAVGLADEYNKMPGALSGGMRKRAGLARAMALDPKLLLVDEPSAGLDPVTTDEIDGLLLSLKRQAGVTIVLVTHNIPSTRRLADIVVMLHEGRIIAQGTPAELDASGDELVRAFMRSEHAG